MVAAGKAAGPMAEVLLRAHGRRVERGVVISPHDQPAGTLDRDARISWVRAGHPAPDEGSVRGGLAALRLAAGLTAGDALIVLLSGGASALMTLPVDGVTLAEKSLTTRVLMAAGADIHALNIVRKHLSRIKGGRLAEACPGPVLAFALSDVVGNDLSVIASGPTVADPTTFGDALAVLSRFDVRARVPRAILGVLERGAAGAIPETPKPGSAVFGRADTRLIGSARDAIEAAAAAASARGYRVAIVDEPICGEARTAGRAHADRVRRAAGGLARPACVISAGETTVTVRGGGRGGRSQEFMLAMVESLPGLGGCVAAASVGTDGIDGPTDAAGAMIDTGTAARLASAHVDAEAVLDDNDAYSALDAIDGLIRTGPTGTNVGDLQVVLLA